MKSRDCVLSTVEFPTRLTSTFGVKYPFVGAGMGYISMPRVVGAVSEAGGLGVLGNGPEPPDGTRALIHQIRALTKRPFGVDFFVVTSTFGPATTDAHVEVAAQEHVPLTVFHFNLPEARWVERLHAAGSHVWMQVASVEEALAATKVGMDGLVIQGAESGGHNKSTLQSLDFLGKARSLFPSMLLLAAGGIADYHSAAEAFMAGADGVWVGTRLIATEEAHAHPEHKRRIIQADEDGTTVTTVFGPELPGKPYRVLRNQAVAAASATISPANPVIGRTTLFPLTQPTTYAMPRFSAIIPDPEATGDFEQMGLAAGGKSAGRISSVKSTREVVTEMMEGAARILAKARH